METIYSVLPIIVLLLIGVLCRKKQIITSAGIDGLQSLVVNITLPVSLFLTFFNSSLSLDVIAYPIILFVVNALGVPFGKILCRLFRKENRFLPFAMTTSENGMIGYALVMVMVGQSNVARFALMDIGQVLGFFIVTYQLLMHELTGEKVNAKGIAKSICTTPMLVGMLAGIICSVSGISGLVANAGLAPAVENLCNFISAPTSAAILIVIGYHINFGHLKPIKVVGAMGMRMLQQAILCVVVLGVFRVLGGHFASALTTISLVVMSILPGSYLLPIYVEPETEKEFYATMISLYTIMSLVVFIVLMFVVSQLRIVF